MIKSLETKVVITIPEELVLVEKAEYQKLVDELSLYTSEAETVVLAPRQPSI